jgi:hypothetical protein
MNLLKRLKNHFNPPALLSYVELVGLVNQGVINAPMSAVNGSSIDLTLHHLARREVLGAAMQTVRLGRGAIPARPFLPNAAQGLPAEWEQDIVAIITRHLDAIG